MRSHQVKVSLRAKRSNLILSFCILVSWWLSFICVSANEPIVLARLKYGGGGDWYNGPTEIPNFARELKKRIQLNVSEKEKVVTLLDKDLYKYPFLFMAGHGNVSFTPQEAKALREYLEAGGFLYADDDYGMDASFRREMKKVFPEAKWQEIPRNHLLYNGFYKFPKGLPKIHEHEPGPPKGLGIFIKGRLVVFYTFNTNISDGWDSPDVHNDPPEKREQAFRMGVNLMVYVLTN